MMQVLHSPFAQRKCSQSYLSEYARIVCFYFAQIYLFVHKCKFLSIIYLHQMAFKCSLSSWGWGVAPCVYLDTSVLVVFFLCV